VTAGSLVAELEKSFQQAKQMDVSLGERLAHIANAVRSLSPLFADAVDQLVTRLEKAGAGSNAPLPGEPMPDFSLPDESGRMVTLHDLLERGPVAVAFHRGHWCPYCRINTVALAGAHASAAASGGQLVAITPDRANFTMRLKMDANAQFPILTDIDNGYAMSLNLAIWVGEEMHELIAKAGWDLAGYQGNDAWMLPIPATFVVAADGVIKARYIDPDYRRRMAIEEMLGALREAC
jgi:peroxiredoxin